MDDLHAWIVIALSLAAIPLFARTYLRHLQKDVHLWLISAFLTGFCTMFGGTYGALMNLYLLKLGHGKDVIGGLNGAFYVGMALLREYPAPILVALWARFVQRERVRPRLWLGLALAPMAVNSSIET